MILKLWEGDPRKVSKKEWQVGEKAQKVAAREPTLTWPGVAYSAEAQEVAAGMGPSLPALSLKLPIVQDHSPPYEAVLPLRRALPNGKFFLKNVEQKQILLFPEHLGNN